MKKLAMFAALLGMAGSAYSQGTFNFDNTAAYSGAPNAFTTDIGAQGKAGEGTPGTVAGSDSSFATPNYDVSFLYQLGTANAGLPLTPDLFKAAGGTNSTLVGSFDAVTGDATDAGGLYGLGTATIPSTTDGTMITVEAIAWYDPTGTTTYSQSEAGGNNVGGGPLVAIRLANGSDLTIADMSTVAGFNVNATAVPEPSIFALSSIGAAALMLIRRKK